MSPDTKKDEKDTKGVTEDTSAKVETVDDPQTGAKDAVRTGDASQSEVEEPKRTKLTKVVKQVADGLWSSKIAVYDKREVANKLASLLELEEPEYTEFIRTASEENFSYGMDASDMEIGEREVVQPPTGRATPGGRTTVPTEKPGPTGKVDPNKPAKPGEVSDR